MVVERIPFVDLQAQNAPLREALDRAVAGVLSSNRFILGPEVARFEADMAAWQGVPAAIGVSSGTDALICLLLAAGVRPGDEVVTTPYSFIATVEAILRIGAVPVFADINPETLNLDPARAAERLGPRTRAVLVVHLFGRAARLDPLAAACAGAGVALLEDAAQAVGATVHLNGHRHPIGTVGAGAALSFFPSKNLGGFGDGGMVLTADRAIAAAVRSLRNHGSDRKHHHQTIGGNFRLDEIQAALLSVKLPHLAAWTEGRRRVADRYRRLLQDLPVRLPPPDDGCVWNQFVIRVRDGHRDALAAHLAGREIETATYYPAPLHLQPAMAFMGHRPGDFPDAEQAARDSLALPMYPHLTEDQAQRVVEGVAGFFSSAGASP